MGRSDFYLSSWNMSSLAAPLPLVSIAMATYNAGTYLREQMTSLLDQTYPNIEIVISDDGSTDGTYAVLERFAELDARVRVLPQGARLGFNGNFARCFAACRGEYISPCDQDDRWQPQKTARLLDACQQVGGAAFCDSRFIDAAGREVQEKHGWRLSQIMVMHSDPAVLRLVFGNCVSGHALMFPRALLGRLPDVPTGGFFDWSIALAIRVNGMPLRYVDEPLVDYRRHHAAVTSVASSPRKADRKARLWLLRWSLLNAAMEKASTSSEGLPKLAAMRASLEIWLSGYFCPRIAWQFLPLRRTLYPGKPAWRQLVSVLGMCWGYRLRSVLAPRRYPPIRQKGREIEFYAADR